MWLFQTQILICVNIIPARKSQLAPLVAQCTISMMRVFEWVDPLIKPLLYRYSEIGK